MSLSDIPSWILAIVIVIGSMAMNAWRSHQRQKEYEGNEAAPPISDHQLRWHIRHIRDDLTLLAWLVGGILLVLLWKL